MCRFLAYIGQPVRMDELLFKPKNSLINQSIRAHETEEPLNGDGFGVGWYSPDLDPTPGLFVSIRPAWNDQNLRYIAPKIRSGTIFAHVRAASKGAVNEQNCHPFHFGNFLFMHNGDIEGFTKLKRPLRRSLSDDIYNAIRGETDSEHFFGLFLNSFYSRKKAKESAEDIAKALEHAIAEVGAMKKKLGIDEPSYINAAITDGDDVVAVRYVSGEGQKAPTLYYSEGSSYECVDGVCRMRRDTEDRAVLIVSERLTSYRSDWNEIPVNHILLVGSDLSMKLRPCEIPD